ncbi:MAG TPA: GAF domain-containing protein, partial [Xanthomonadaceae bacterium]|nr:GAF domain-containing protein [Xanthomonadaceae bacterium]
MLEDIASELDLEPLLARIVEHACALIGADDGTIGLYEPSCDAIRTVAAWNMPAAELGALMPRGIGLAGEVLASGRPLMRRYGDIPTATLPELAGNHVIGVPVRWRGEMIGFFGIGVRAPHRFNRRDVAMLKLFARYAAVAIVNARRYTSEHRRRLRFHLIARVAGIIVQDLARDEFLQRAADAIHELLEFPNVDIPLLDPDDPDTLVVRIRGGSYKRLIRREDRVPVAQGIMGAAVRERRTLLINDVPNDPRYLCPDGVTPPQAELAVPIRLGREVLGVINVESDQPFDALDAESLEVVAEHLALALNNVRLSDAARENAVLLERQRLAHDLHDSVTQILSSMNLLAQTLPGVWRRDPQEGERRSRRRCRKERDRDRH